MIIKLKSLSALILLTLSLSACVIKVGSQNDGDYHNGGNISSVFGSIQVDKGRKVGDVSSVNGNIIVKDRVIADDISAVNGGIQLGDSVIAEEISTVNGDIQAGDNLTVRGDISTTNGSINIRSNSRADGSVSTVNGTIIINDSIVNGDVTTDNGSISLTGNTRVMGNVVFSYDNDERPDPSQQPTLTVGTNAHIEGVILLQRSVTLVLPDNFDPDKIKRDFRFE